MKSKSKQLKQVFDAKDNGPASAIEMQDEDNSHEEEMALASPMRGSKSQNYWMSEDKRVALPEASKS